MAPWQLVDQLCSWAEATEWCQWVELAGSLARDAGDHRSDVDAGVGVEQDFPFSRARDEALDAMLGFSPVADSLVQVLGTDPAPTEHLIIQYQDGRQLSVVVSLAQLRPGLPPGARAVFDRAGQLAKPWKPESLSASSAQTREWAFLAWWALSDVAKHSERGSIWRALTSLDEARAMTWRLHAASLGVDYPTFGAVSVENANLPAPIGMAHTMVAKPDRQLILSAATALSVVLESLTAELEVAGMSQLAMGRIRSAALVAERSAGVP